jgi:hypothetical protein
VGGLYVGDELVESEETAPLLLQLAEALRNSSSQSPGPPTADRGGMPIGASPGEAVRYLLEYIKADQQELQEFVEGHSALSWRQELRETDPGGRPTLEIRSSLGPKHGMGAARYSLLVRYDASGGGFLAASPE